MPNALKIDSKLPERLVRLTQGLPEINKAQRTIRAQIVTRKIGRDGGIVLPDGIITRFYEQNPVVLAEHGQKEFPLAPAVIGRSLKLEKNNFGMTSTTQFADNEIGRQYAYLYGLNEGREVYMRAWSFGWSVLKIETWSLDEARTFLGKDFDADAIDALTQRMNQVWVSMQSEMHEYSAVPVGADRDALSRAFGQKGIRIAGQLLNDIDTQTGLRQIADLQKEFTEIKTRLGHLETDVLALSREGAAAAERGDTAAVLDELQSLTAKLRGNKNGPVKRSKTSA